MDAGLRQLEQAWRKSGSVEDEAAWLSARAAAGTLEPERLRFCALLVSIHHRVPEFENLSIIFTISEAL